MNIVKFTAAAACGLSILLLVVAFTIKAPETALYKETVELLMKQEGITSDKEIEECFPILLEIQSNISRIADLKQKVRSQTSNPAPTITEEEALQLDDYTQQIHRLQSGVRTQLVQLITTCILNQS